MKYKPKLPKRWDPHLAYFFGLLLGDGSLPEARSKRPNGNYQKRYIIYFYSSDRTFVYEIYLPLFKKLFDLSPRVEIWKKKNSDIYCGAIESKEIYLFLERKGFTIGRKARIAKIPKFPKKYYFDLLAGLLDTDGGKKGNGFGLSTASKHLALFCENIFEDLKLPYNSCPWKFKDHVYHQVYVPGKYMHKLLGYIPLKNQNKINFLKSQCPDGSAW